MFVLDTNILSAMIAPQPATEVAAFVSGQPTELLFTASICQAEILSGIAILPEGRRRLGLEAAARAMFLEDFEGRVLPFDEEAAIAYAEFFAARRRAGRPAAAADLMIAAVAYCRNASIVTRNAADFEACNVAIVNPWER
ncbi:MAG: PIN domain-containing protein [Methylocella sp.]